MLPYHYAVMRCSPTDGVMQECKKSFFLQPRYLRLREANYETVAKGHQLLWNMKVKHQPIKNISSWTCPYSSWLLKKVFHQRMVKSWNRLPRAVDTAPCCWSSRSVCIILSEIGSDFLMVICGTLMILMVPFQCGIFFNEFVWGCNG